MICSSKSDLYDNAMVHYEFTFYSASIPCEITPEISKMTSEDPFTYVVQLRGKHGVAIIPIPLLDTGNNFVLRTGAIFDNVARAKKILKINNRQGNTMFNYELCDQGPFY